MAIWQPLPTCWDFNNEHFEDMLPKKRTLCSINQQNRPTKTAEHGCNPHRLFLSKPKRGRRQSRHEGYHAGAKSPKLWSTRTSLKFVKCAANPEGDLQNHHSPLELSSGQDCANMLSQCTFAEINLAGELLAKRAQEGLLSTHITHLTNGENMRRIWSWNYPSFFRSWRNWSASKPAPSRPPALL